MFTNNVANSELNLFIPDNNSITILDLILRHDDYKNKDFVDAQLVAFNLKLIDRNKV